MSLRNILLAIGVAALTVGLALAAIWIQQGGSSRPASGPGADEQSVLVAASALHPGTLLRREDLAWKRLPADRVPPAAIRMAPNAEQTYLGAVVRRDFAAGEPLVPGGLVLPGTSDFLAAVLSPGMRAVALAVDAASSAAGLIQPGDHVDVLLAQNLDTSTNRQNAVSETVLQNVRVIAVDQTFAAGTRTASPGGRFGTVESRIPKTVTLEVSEADAKRLLVAGQLGKLTLAVRALAGTAMPERSAGDTAPIWAGEVSAAMGGGRTQPRSAASGRAAVTILRGSKVETQ